MKKIMFNDKYGLTQAVLEGRKTMTRRIIKVPNRKVDGKEVCGFEIHKTNDGIPYDVWLTGPNDESLCQLLPTYKRGEIVAVAQPYNDIIGSRVFFKSSETGVSVHRSIMESEKGWVNKMNIAAEFMPHHIRITDIVLDKMQDISDEDCMKEGIRKYGFMCYKWEKVNTPLATSFRTCIDAFADLVDKVNGKGTWESNPWVFSYTFELVD